MEGLVGTQMYALRLPLQPLQWGTLLGPPGKTRILTIFASPLWPSWAAVGDPMECLVLPPGTYLHRKRKEKTPGGVRVIVVGFRGDSIAHDEFGSFGHRVFPWGHKIHGFPTRAGNPWFYSP